MPAASTCSSFSEDDLLPRDTGLIDKQLWFTETFGQRRVLLPNRYEWNLKGPAAKTFIDGDLVSRLTRPLVFRVA